MPQQPRVVCGECNTSVVVEPFKTVDYSCPSCRKWHKVRLPAKPMPLNMYNISVVSCNCGFRGEVSVGRLMDVSCSECWTTKRELRGVWSDDGDEVRFHCDACQDQRRGFLRTPQKKAARPTVCELEFKCEMCPNVQPIHAEELLRNQGLAYCGGCGWVGYPETKQRGAAAAPDAQEPAKGQKHAKSKHGARPEGLLDEGAAPTAPKPKTKVQPLPPTDLEEYELDGAMSLVPTPAAPGRSSRTTSGTGARRGPEAWGP